MLVDGGTVRKLELNPARYGFAPCTPEDVAVDSKEAAAAVLQEILAGRGSEAMRGMVALNVGLGLFLLQKFPSMDECMRAAVQAVNAGAAQEVLHAA